MRASRRNLACIRLSSQARIGSSPQVVAAIGLVLGLPACSGGAGSSSGTDPGSAPEMVEQSNSSAVAEPVGEPTVMLRTVESLIDRAAMTTLEWDSGDASECEASGGWTGDRATAGSIQVGPLDDHTTFTLTCTGGGGTGVAMTTVNIAGTLRLSWSVPTENEDGSPLMDLAGFNVYYGDKPRDYSDSVAVDDPASTSTKIRLIAGEYYAAMTAVNTAGDESALSNEVLRSAQ